MKHKKIYAAIFVVIIIIGFVIKTKKNNNTEMVTQEIFPEYRSIASIISTTGLVEPRNRLELKPPISGRIESIYVKEGELVKKGQRLALMSSTDRAALIDAAEAHNAEKAEYWKDVYKPTPLLAPINGTIIVRAVEPGQTVMSGEPILVLSDHLIVKAHVDETDIGKIKIGKKAVIKLDAYPDVKIDAHVQHISYESQMINNVTIYEVDIMPKSVPKIFRSGMSASVDIVEKSKENALTIPLDTIKHEKGRTYVFVKDNGEKKQVSLELGIMNETHAEVLLGITESDIIIKKVPMYKLKSRSKQKRSPFEPARKKSSNKKKK